MERIVDGTHRGSNASWIERIVGNILAAGLLGLFLGDRR
jgi:hypothetical protein